MKRTRLAVITATQGQKGTRPESLKGPLGKERIKEDVAGTNLLGADFYANLGFMDGEVSDDEALLVNRLTHYLSVLRPHAVLLADPEDPVHEDHKAVTRAAIQAIINNKMNPIVVYKEFQNGNRELTRDHVAYRLSLDEYEIVRKAFFIHETQTADLSDDIRELVGRPFRNAEVFGFDVPIGVFRQDPRFSQVSFGNYLGDRVIPLPEAEHDLRIFNERIRGYLPRTANNAQVIFDADETS